MGYDITAHVEVKIKGTWHHLHELEIDRNYALFDLMAGVFGGKYQAPITSPRGLPEDCTFLTKFSSEYWLGSHHSWLSAGEVAQVVRWAIITQGKPYNSFGTIFGCGWTCFEECPKGIEDARLIFWFDN